MEEKKKMVIVLTHGFDDERSSVGWSIANGGIKAGFEVNMFLVSSAVDWVRKGAADSAQLNPLDPPIKEMMKNVMDAGGKIMVCPPCAEVRGYKQEDFLDGVIITGSVAMHELIMQGAATLSF